MTLEVLQRKGKLNNFFCLKYDLIFLDPGASRGRPARQFRFVLSCKWSLSAD